MNHLVEERGQHFLVWERAALVDFDVDLIAADVGDFGICQRKDDGTAELLEALGALVVVLAEAGREQTLGQFLYDFSLEFCNGSDDLESEDAVVERHPTGFSPACWEGELVGRGWVDELTEGVCCLVAEFSGEDEGRAVRVRAECQFEPLGEGKGWVVLRGLGFLDAEGGAEVAG